MQMVTCVMWLQRWFVVTVTTSIWDEMYDVFFVDVTLHWLVSDGCRLADKDHVAKNLLPVLSRLALFLLVLNAYIQPCRWSISFLRSSLGIALQLPLRGPGASSSFCTDYSCSPGQRKAWRKARERLVEMRRCETHKMREEGWWYHKPPDTSQAQPSSPCSATLSFTGLSMWRFFFCLYRRR